MTEMTMRERVARAMRPTHFAIYDAGCGMKCLPERAKYLRAVREVAKALNDAEAAIAAMREPTKPMVDKAWSLLRSNLRYEEVYPYLIDAALAKEPHDA